MTDNVTLAVARAKRAHSSAVDAYGVYRAALDAVDTDAARRAAAYAYAAAYAAAGAAADAAIEVASAAAMAAIEVADAAADAAAACWGPYEVADAAAEAAAAYGERVSQLRAQLARERAERSHP